MIYALLHRNLNLGRNDIDNEFGGNMIKYKSLNEFFPEGRADGSWFIQKDQEEMIEFQPFFRDRNQRWVGLNSSGFYTIVGVDQLWKQVILNDDYSRKVIVIKKDS